MESITDKLLASNLLNPNQLILLGTNQLNVLGKKEKLNKYDIF